MMRVLLPSWIWAMSGLFEDLLLSQQSKCTRNGVKIMGTRSSTAESTIGFSIKEAHNEKYSTRITLSDLDNEKYELRFNGFAVPLAGAPPVQWFEEAAQQIFQTC